MNEFEKPTENTENAESKNPSDVLAAMPSFEDFQSDLEKKKKENFEKFADFIKKDSEIKQNLGELAPGDGDFYGDAAIDYADRLYEGIRDIKTDMKSMMRSYFSSEALEKRLEKIEQDVAEAGANPDRLSEVYKNDFAAMSQEFVDDVQNGLRPYSTRYNPRAFEDRAGSVNEILHLLHSTVMNNDNIYKGLPVLGHKVNDKYGLMNRNLLGTEESKNPVAVGLFDKLCEDQEEGDTDIISLENRTIAMIRDRGHATTMDIEKDENDGRYYVKYFIPKILNVDMVNKLPGVRKVMRREGEKQIKDTTTGVFSVENEGDVVGKVMEFIKMIPTDEDMEVPPETQARLNSILQG
jgi:transcription termination factor NusB